MDNSQDDSEVPVSTLSSSPPRSREPNMTHEQIHYQIVREILRFWQQTREITGEQVGSLSVEGVEVCVRKFKHYQYRLDFIQQTYKRFFEEPEDRYKPLIESFDYFKGFIKRQIEIIETYLNLLIKTEEERALEEERIRISNEVQRSIRSLNNL
ncbi:UNVERIFIED_CONTAM: hypothetical protein RMT77_019144 [Armadillidium vulgare]